MQELELLRLPIDAHVGRWQESLQQGVPPRVQVRLEAFAVV